jgi:hypothetical protein
LKSKEIRSFTQRTSTSLIPNQDFEKGKDRQEHESSCAKRRGEEYKNWFRQRSQLLYFATIYFHLNSLEIITAQQLSNIFKDN